MPWLFIALVLFYPGLRQRLHASDAAPASEGGDSYDDYVHRCRPGPWGELQYSRIVIEPPDEFAAGDYSTATPPRWAFVGYSRGDLTALWRTAGLTEAQIVELEAPGKVEVRADAIIVHPSIPLVLDLSTDARSTIYSALSAFPENPDQFEPFRFRADTSAEWFEHSQLAPETIAQVRKLLYRRGSSLLFSDHNALLPRIPSNAERVKLVKTLARKATLLVKLRVRSTSDLSTLAEYWGRGPRRKGMRALLESIAQRPEGITLDLSHLLPRFPRAHLFTYPQLPEEGTGHDCHWTSLNFFNDPADPRFTDTEFVKQTIEREYAPVEGRLMLGDVLMFTQENGTVIHSCVYVADDIVFTKNGAAEVMPWILMNLSDVLAFYPSNRELTIHAYRRKDV